MAGTCDRERGKSAWPTLQTHALKSNKEDSQAPRRVLNPVHKHPIRGFLKMCLPEFYSLILLNCLLWKITNLLK
jgi:hypothetical protein